MSSKHDTKTRSSATGPLAVLARLLRVPGRRAPSYGLLTAVAVLGALCLPAAASAYNLTEFDITFTDAEGETVNQAGAHPGAVTATLGFPSLPTGEGGAYTDEPPKDAIVGQIPGLVGNPTAVPYCSTVDFLTKGVTFGAGTAPGCPDATALGTIAAKAAAPKELGSFYGPIFSLAPPPGVAAKMGLWINNVPITLEFGVAEDPPYNIIARSINISQLVEVIGSTLTIWGVPADSSHNELRGRCLDPSTGGPTGVSCPAGISPVPFLTVPRACKGPLESIARVASWAEPGVFGEDSVETHNSLGEPEGFKGCEKLGFDPEASARPSSASASSPSGLDFTLETNNPGLENPEGISNSDLDKAVVTLPRGMTANPSQAEGLETCTEAQLDAESPFLSPGEGDSYVPPSQRCPEASKIGTVEVETPILENRVLRGAVYVATPYENRFGTLLALYMVIRDPKLGVVLKVPLKVVPDPGTGQLVTISEDLPPFPFSSFRLHLREGARSPLITPPGCGTFHTNALLYPSSGGQAVESNPSFEIVSGPNGGPCPSGTAKFEPGFEAGTRNNAAGRYSPFDMRITRRDGEQDITKFSSVLPPGVLARLAGTSWCPEAGIARARSRTGENGGTQEQNDPSCPATSQIGTTVGGAGAGGQLTYVGGKLYLAGPYNGAPLSVAAIVPAVAGPFDAGTVVVRVALRLNPVTGVAEADGAASDPIPHILQGIPLNVRELRVQVDKPDFTLNATSCAELETKATLWGGGTALAPLPDSPVGLSSRYQAASCASLAFKPKLAIKLFGGTKRGDFPALRAIVTPPPGQANFARAAVTLPRSAFLEQGHIRTVCTRVQFAAGAGHGSQCPKGAIYGKARAWSPLLDAPAEGPVYLRSSSNKLPDLVVALKGPASAPVDVELSSRIDSVKIGRDGAGIRSIFTGIPDVPVSRFVLAMQGGKKGLIVNSGNLCHKPARNRARANLLGQNGRRYNVKPVVRAVKCAKKRRKAKRSSHRRARIASAGTVR